jgi:hypothetical protein
MLTPAMLAVQKNALGDCSLHAYDHVRQMRPLNAGPIKPVDPMDPRNKTGDGEAW